MEAFLSGFSLCCCFLFSLSETLNKVALDDVNVCMWAYLHVLEWFFDAPFRDIFVENLCEWIAGALFCKDPSDLRNDEHQEMWNLVRKLETEKLQRPLPLGKNSNISCPRLALGIIPF